MKHIIIPVDFSKQSEFALQTGAILAKKHGSILHVLHMLELSDSIISNSDTQNQNEMMFMLALAKKKFEPFLDKSYLDGVEVIPMIKHHKVYNEVDTVAKEVNADLIIMGSHGLTAQDGIFAGSNSEKMVRNSSTPVLIVKTEPTNFKLDKAVFATDLSIESVPAFKKAETIITSLGSTIYPIFVNTPHSNFLSTRDFNKKALEFEKAGGSNNVKFIAGHNVEDGLIQYAEQTGADCIVVITHARKGLNHFLKGSISEDLANHAKLPVITFKK